MHIFLTGATGFIGRALIPQLLSASHTLTCLSRSPSSTALLISLGLNPSSIVTGSLSDLDILEDAAANADAVIHLAFVHNFENFQASVKVDGAAIRALAKGLVRSAGKSKSNGKKTLVITTGTLLLPQGRVCTEEDRYDKSPSASALNIRGESEELTKELARELGIRGIVVRLAPVVHGDGDRQFVPALISLAREKRVSAYVGDGSNRWPAVHVQDVAFAYRLAVERDDVPGGSTLHFVGEGGIPVRDIAGVIGEKLGVGVASVGEGDAAKEHFGWIAGVVGRDGPVESVWTREVLGWEPRGKGLIEDLREGSYFG